MASFFDLAELDRTPPQQGFSDAAVRAWMAHLDAGRLASASPAPPPPPPGCDYGFAALAPFLRPCRRGPRA